jgi:hypothetical protein
LLLLSAAQDLAVLQVAMQQRAALGPCQLARPVQAHRTQAMNILLWRWLQMHCFHVCIKFHVWPLQLVGDAAANAVHVPDRTTNNNNNVTACPPMVPTSRVVPPVVKTPQKLRVVTRHAV